MELQNPMTRSAEYLLSLVHTLCALPAETEWVEFKTNQNEREIIGKNISALANSAVLVNQPYAYLVWGIRDGDHAVVGTKFRPHEELVGNNKLESWLLQKLGPKINFNFWDLLVDGSCVVLLEIEPAPHQPVGFDGQRYVRIGSTTRPLKGYPEKERALWRLFDRTPFEDRIAAERVNDNELLRSIDYSAYFELRGISPPDDQSGILEVLASEQLIHPCQAGGWNVSNLALVLFSRQLTNVPFLRRRAIRVIKYRGRDSAQIVADHTVVTGYASGYEDLIACITDLQNVGEEANQSRSERSWLYLEPAVRELVANALMHQDFFVVGSGPMVEIYADRIEFINPGTPLVDLTHSVKAPPRSRNRGLVAFMRRFGICRALGSGWSGVTTLCSEHNLPVPRVDVINDYTRVVLFTRRSSSSLDSQAR